MADFDPQAAPTGPVPATPGPTLPPGPPPPAAAWGPPPGAPGMPPGVLGVPPGVPPGGELPPGPMPPQPPRKRHTWMWVAIGAGALVILCAGAVVTGAVLSVRGYHRAHRQISAALGQPAQDGQLMFTADKVTCGVTEVGPPEDYVTPTGQFCVVELNIRNVGTGPAIFADALQEAYAANGDRYGTDSAAGLFANPDPTIFFNDINPGIDVKALVVYDIPKGGDITRLELHESPGSKGVLIKVR